MLCLASRVEDRPKTLGTTAVWGWPAYTVLAGYWIVSGLGGAFDTDPTAVTPVTTKMFGQSSTSTPGFGFWTMVGVGLAARLEFARGVANLLAALKVLFGALGVLGSLLSTLMVGPLGFLFAVLHTLDVVAGAMTIYLIGETERSGPRF